MVNAHINLYNTLNFKKKIIQQYNLCYYTNNGEQRGIYTYVLTLELKINNSLDSIWYISFELVVGSVLLHRANLKRMFLFAFIYKLRCTNYSHEPNYSTKVSPEVHLYIV